MKNDQFSGEIKHSFFFSCQSMSSLIKSLCIYLKFLFHPFFAVVFFVLLGMLVFFIILCCHSDALNWRVIFSIKKSSENKNWNQFHFSESAQIKALLNVEMENPIQWYLLTKRGGPIYIHLFYTVCVFFHSISHSKRDVALKYVHN